MEAVPLAFQFRVLWMIYVMFFGNFSVFKEKVFLKYKRVS